MQRLLILGGPGAGKSTLALAVGEKLGLPIHHSDQTYWTEGWQVVPHEVRMAAFALMIAEEKWVLDGCLAAIAPSVAERADLIVHLSLPAPQRQWRLIRRRIANIGRPRLGGALGCNERLSLRELRFAASYQRRWGDTLNALRRDHRAKFVDLAGRAGIRTYLATLGGDLAQPSA